MHPTRTTPLRERMRQELQLAGLSARTQEAYPAKRDGAAEPQFYFGGVSGREVRGISLARATASGCAAAQASRQACSSGSTESAGTPRPSTAVEYAIIFALTAESAMRFCT